MCSLPKDFEKTTEVLPFTKNGLSSIEEFRKADEDIKLLERLKKAGLSAEEIKLYHENEKGLLNAQNKIESSVLQAKLTAVYLKLNPQSVISETNVDDSTSASNKVCETLQKTSIKTYPDGHPMNDIKSLERKLFGHLSEEVVPITKRRKILRRLQRKKEKLQHQNFSTPVCVTKNQVARPGSLWDVKELPCKQENQITKKKHPLGPKKQTFYTIRKNKIVRLEPMDPADDNGGEYRAVDIVVPINNAESQLLEGTKMSVDDIKKIDRFKDYEPGIPSKVLYLKNIAPTVTQEQLSLLFNQFVLDNGGPIDVRLMTGRMRGQAFVGFRDENLAIQALHEINGTIVSGRPIIAQFGRNTNRVQGDDG